MKLGKYKKTLSEECSVCGGLLQERVVELDIYEGGYLIKTENKVQIVCMSCEKILSKKSSKGNRRHDGSNEKNDLGW